MSAIDPASLDAQIESLTQALERTPDAEAQRCARELVRLVLELHRNGLGRILDIIGTGPEVLARRLADDPLVASLLALHELGATDDSARGVPRLSMASTPLLQIIRSPAASAPAMHGHGADRPRCDACGEPLGEPHHHLVDIVTRELSCSCRACWLLSAAPAGSASRRPVPDRYVAGDFRVTAAQWDALQVPVGTAFFMRNSIVGRTIAFYPSPAGATESALSLAAWHAVEDDNPWVRTAAPDVEAVLVRQERGDARYDAFIVPIDACYDLVGRLRRHGNSLDGGFGAQVEIDRFLAEVAARSRREAAPVTARP